jgi:hypothetical protein
MTGHLLLGSMACLLVCLQQFAVSIIYWQVRPVQRYINLIGFALYGFASIFLFCDWWMV